MSDPRPPRYLKPMNKFMMAVQKLGIPIGPAMVLTVPGRKSGQPRSTPMTPFEFGGGLYVVAGYPGAGWAAHARAAGRGPAQRGPPAPARQDRRTDCGTVASDTSGFPGGGPRRRGVRQALRHGRRRYLRRIRGAGGTPRGVPVRPGHQLARPTLKAGSVHAFPRTRRL